VVDRVADLRDGALAAREAEWRAVHAGAALYPLARLRGPV
jgi:hypothetical protein